MKKKTIKIAITILLILGIIAATLGCTQASDEQADATNTNQTMATQGSYIVVDTGQNSCYDNSEIISYPEPGEPFYGQDAQYNGNQLSYQDNGDGTITDLVTGLMWAQDQSESSMDWAEAPMYAESLTLGGYTDWRVPTIKELWSTRDFSTGWPWVDTDYFNLVSDDGGDQRQQHSWSSNYYLVDTEEAAKNVAFIVNDWTGHIKALDGRRYVRCVRGDTYGINDFVDNEDSTITDAATGLMWAQEDSGTGMDWETALAYAEDSTYASYDDWRLPNVKELQSIVDYSGVFPAIDSMFNISEITNEAGNADYPYFWTSTSNPYIDPREDPAGYWYAWYVAFGYAVDPDGNDCHGAGAVRFDTKAEGDPSGEGAPRVYNYVRLVRGGLNDDQAPEKPEKPEGSTSGESGTEYSYVTSTTDPDGDEVHYKFDWGEGAYSEWLGPYASGEEINVSHVWDSKGSYEIKVKAKDTDGVQSEWSDPLAISMPKSDSIISQLYQFIEEKPVVTMVAGGIGIVLLS